MRIFEKSGRRASVSIAKERLKTLLVSEKAGCMPDTYERMCDELYRTISKYMKTEKESFGVEITHSKIVITLIGDES